MGNLASGKSALVHRYLTGTYVQEESPEGMLFSRWLVTSLEFRASVFSLAYSESLMTHGKAIGKTPTSKETEVYAPSHRGFSASAPAF